MIDKNLSEEDRRRIVDALVVQFSNRLMGAGLISGLKTGGPPVDTWMRKPRPEGLARQRDVWRVERRLVEMPSRMTIDAEYEIE